MASKSTWNSGFVRPLDYRVGDIPSWGWWCSCSSLLQPKGEELCLPCCSQKSLVEEGCHLMVQNHQMMTNMQTWRYGPLGSEWCGPFSLWYQSAVAFLFHAVICVKINLTDNYRAPASAAWSVENSNNHHPYTQKLKNQWEEGRRAPGKQLQLNVANLYTEDN